MLVADRANDVARVILAAKAASGRFSVKKADFSPELNTLIGIRGSGKSSILEAIRYALDIPRGEKVVDTKYKDELIKHTLGSGGKVTLTPGTSYQVADGAEPHRSSTATGVRLFIVD